MTPPIRKRQLQAGYKKKWEIEIGKMKEGQKKLILECGGKEGDVTLLDCTNTEERGEEEEEGKKTCTLPTRGSRTQQWKESAGRVRNFPFCRRSGYLLLLLKLRQSSVRPSPSQHGASISLQGKVRTRVRTQKGRRIEGCDAHSFPHRERKNNNKRTRNERRNKQRKNTKHVGRKKKSSSGRAVIFETTPLSSRAYYILFYWQIPIRRRI